MLNHIVLMGRLTRDPELRRTGSGVAVASFTLAVDRDFGSRDSGEKETDISPMILKSAVCLKEGALLVSVVLTVDNEKFLNPEYIVTCLKEKANVLSGSPLDEEYSILRTGVYGKDGALFR